MWDAGVVVLLGFMDVDVDVGWQCGQRNEVKEPGALELAPLNILITILGSYFGQVRVEGARRGEGHGWGMGLGGGLDHASRIRRYLPLRQIAIYIRHSKIAHCDALEHRMSCAYILPPPSCGMDANSSRCAPRCTRCQAVGAATAGQTSKEKRIGPTKNTKKARLGTPEVCACADIHPK